ncbi:molybdopterin synthase catalytic subunit MoaE [Pseudoteredinibacter isoporae]|uniref:Molybdopterin synthase catalytic subunit n=1 Tax=Pseudoteredinibacter isoporae TaxID=570281 RepID=A0A7X0MX08_9GAMM|nr:molybdopterin synthase catalytic subunit MoaE [Pseudoteredinibacter isoporae]MBB6522780.1 molybdopterin synthase catalytic subunit [Pseudoteredinibacter isoporae]NHO88307.1 molybdopterin synthase catalytic subunit MoaE [Pseudoteredinibacter isoporae]NIB23362.1 molybdopterin synthase catalytic subunit MoaE [Pseudoteredinibacter isoporae]
MTGRLQLSVQAQDFDIEEEYRYLRNNNSESGAVVTFLGQVRDFNLGEDVSELELEHYPGMTESVLQKLLEEADKRWVINRAKIIHRVGALGASDKIVWVAVASAHRGDAFKACEFLIDALKTQAPFWKKERSSQGERWLDARDSDQDKARQWMANDDS